MDYSLSYATGTNHHALRPCSTHPGGVNRVTDLGCSYCSDTKDLLKTTLQLYR